MATPRDLLLIVIPFLVAACPGGSSTDAAGPPANAGDAGPILDGGGDGGGGEGASPVPEAPVRCDPLEGPVANVTPGGALDGFGCGLTLIGASLFFAVERPETVYRVEQGAKPTPIWKGGCTTCSDCDSLHTDGTRLLFGTNSSLLDIGASGTGSNVVVAGTPGAVTVDGDRVYVSGQGIAWAPAGGGSLTVLDPPPTSGSNGVFPSASVLALDESYVYYAGSTYPAGASPAKQFLLRIPKAGGARQTLAELPNGPYTLALTKSEIYVAVVPTGNATTLFRVPKTGGEVHAVNAGSKETRALLSDSGWIYFFDGMASPRGVFRLRPECPDVQRLTSDSDATTNEVSAFVSDASRVYWLRRLAGELRQSPIESIAK